ncbi:aspartyl-phosphate phosphatase Spo0E family protein|uniref:Spo0E like sporulation regulatory protein n=1 Tax=Dendrosporobacter quercicolus TaxID=146817 RepID=A0A1G9MA44_9FIRM|nr:aspartyl-phosphate phosphatase Spo0E family protein [Dendrosporobacter quercicolus]NSL46973.1 aspartyl-phosphate phosphatase Spo0E family protein [Dendrosporobacter quercicolus DSM 1736]SDL71130.1 Spo0E like sporulation regulatory protein [Dendrosporobacter quercicolus]
MCTDIWKEVEKLQLELHDVVSKKGIGSPEAIRVSQDFREKMDEYRRCSTQR